MEFNYLPAYVNETSLIKDATFTTFIRPKEDVDTLISSIHMEVTYQGHLVTPVYVGLQKPGVDTQYTFENGVLKFDITSDTPIVLTKNDQISFLFKTIRNLQPGEVFGMKFLPNSFTSFDVKNENGEEIDEFEIVSQVITVLGPEPYADLSLPTVAERKAAQYYSSRPFRPTCYNCAHLLTKEDDDNYPRCALGDFAVATTAICGLHKLTF